MKGNSTESIDREGPMPPVDSADEEGQIINRKNPHECPIPKPGGLIGEVLGFKREGQAEKRPRPRIETGTPQRSKKEES